VRKRDIALCLLDRAGKPLPNRAVRAVQTESDFLWGFCGWGLLNALREGRIVREGAQRQFHYLAELFNSVNLMHYWVELHCADAPVSEEYQGHLDYENLQQGVDWALAHGLTPKGHPIFWPVPKAIPEWLLKYDYETRLKFLEVRVRTLTARFRRKIKLYDAVNEAIWEPSLRGTEVRHWPHLTPVEEMVEYIELVLRWAREEDPEARYLLNDYGILVGHLEDVPVPANDGSMVNRDLQARRYQKLVLALKARGAAPDAVGIQGFFGGWGHHDQDLATLDLLGTQTGLPVHITEFGSGGGNTVRAMQEAGAPREEILQRMGQYAENVMVTCFAHPSVEAFYFWYDMDYLKDGKGYPSSYYKRLYDLIHREWRTEVRSATDASGRLRFRGFCGQYRVYLEGGGQVRGVGFHVPEIAGGEVRLDLRLPV
jgi:GH35 family endo-1,4-beta-xylanase